MLGMIKSRCNGRSDLPSCRARRWPSCALALMNFVFIAWAPTAWAQLSASEPGHHELGNKVSVHELQIPDKARDAFLRGVECLQKGDAAASLAHFKLAIEQSPDYYEAYYHRGLALIRFDQTNEAIKSFQKAIDLSGGRYARAYFGYGHALTRLGKPKEAEAMLRRGLQEDSSLSEGYTALSLVLIEEHRLNEAEDMAHRALLTRDSFAWKAFLALATIHLNKGEYQPAVEDLESYLRGLRAQSDKPLIQSVEKALGDLNASVARQDSVR